MPIKITKKEQEQVSDITSLAVAIRTIIDDQVNHLAETNTLRMKWWNAATKKYHLDPLKDYHVTPEGFIEEILQEEAKQGL